MEYSATTNHAQGGYAPRTVTVGNKLSEPEATKLRDALTGTEELLSTISEELARLESRIETVLRPMPPSGVDGAARTPQAINSHVVGRLYILNEGFASVASRLRELRDRIEV